MSYGTSAGNYTTVVNVGQSTTASVPGLTGGQTYYFAVAAYSALLLASLLTFGVARGTTYAALPKWRRHARRPSCLDLVTLLRKEMVEHPELVEEFDFAVTDTGLTRAAAA